jgi:hypothetical protein
MNYNLLKLKKYDSCHIISEIIYFLQVHDEEKIRDRDTNIRQLKVEFFFLRFK